MSYCTRTGESSPSGAEDFAARESVANRAQEIENRSDERLRERERHLADREAQLESLERMASNEKQSLERERSTSPSWRGRQSFASAGWMRARRRLPPKRADLEKRATELAHLEEHVERRVRELEAYVARVQGSLPSLP